MGGRIEGFAAWQAIARLAVVASAAVCLPCAPAASVNANLSVSVVVTRQCGISLAQDPGAQPRPLCRSGTVATHSLDRNAQLKYSGTTDPVSIERRPGGHGAPDAWVITF